MFPTNNYLYWHAVITLLHCSANTYNFSPYCQTQLDYDSVILFFHFKSQGILLDMPAGRKTVLHPRVFLASPDSYPLQGRGRTDTAEQERWKESLICEYKWPKLIQMIIFHSPVFKFVLQYFMDTTGLWNASWLTDFYLLCGHMKTNYKIQLARTKGMFLYSNQFFILYGSDSYKL